MSLYPNSAHRPPPYPLDSSDSLSIKPEPLSSFHSPSSPPLPSSNSHPHTDYNASHYTLSHSRPPIASSSARRRKSPKQIFMSLVPATLVTRLFLLTTVVETAFDITIEAVLLGRFESFYSGNLFRGVQDADERQALPVYLAIFVLAHFFQLYLCIDAIRNKNTIQVIGLCIFNILFLIYAVIQIQEIRQAFDGLKSSVSVLIDVIPIVISACEVSYIWLTYYIYREFGWTIYKQIGADRRIKKFFLQYQIFICFLKFDYFFFFAFSMQFVLLVLNQDPLERWLTLAAAPVSLVLLMLAYYAVRHEIRWMMYVTLAGCGLAAGYFGFKLFRIFQQKDGDYKLVFKSLSVFSAISLLLLIGTFIQAIICLRNFDKGLKQAMNKNRGRREKNDDLAGDGNGMHYHLSSASASRLSID